MTNELLLAAGSTAALTALFVGLFLVYARRRSLLAVPEARSSHTVPTPLGGGVGMLAAAVCVLCVMTFVVRSRELAAAVPALAVAGLTGFLDDRKPLRPRTKMLGLLIAAAVALLVTDFPGVELPGRTFLAFGVLAVPLALFWYAGFANAFNFMDGINGISGLTLVIVGGALVVGYEVDIVESRDAAVLGAVAAGAGLGFLPWNFPRARIFMGDSGSLPFGMLLAIAIVAAARGKLLGPPGVPFPAGVLLVGPYVFDVTFTLWRRRREGKRLGEAHKEHLYQRLARGFGSHVPSSLVFAALHGGCAFLALTYPGRSTAGQVLSLTLPPLALLLSTRWVFRREAARS